MAIWRKVIVSGSDAELNTLDIGGGSGGTGTTLSTAGAITADAAITAGTSFVIGSADINETDLEKLDGITNGTAAANKAVVLDGSKNIATIGTIGCGAITSTGTSTFGTAIEPDTDDGATIGSANKNWSDLYIADAGVIYLGDDQDVSLTHVVDTGVLLSSTDQLQFGDSGTFIHQSADGVLTITSDTTVDINGAVVFDGNVSGIGTLSSGAATVASLICTAAGTFGGGYGATGVTISTAGVIQANGNIETAGSFVIGSADMSETDLEKLDGITNGTAAASKALVLDASKDIGTIRNLTIDGTFSDGNYTFDTSGNVSGLGTVSCGAITSTGTSTFATAASPDAVAGATLGSTGAEWGHIYIADDSKIQFGNDQDVTIEYDEDGTDELRFAGNAVTFEQAVTFDGAVTLGNATGDSITVLGNSTFSGTTIANLGTVSAATSITSTAFVGPIDGIVGGNTPAAGTFTSLAATGNATITGDLIVNGTTTTLATSNLLVEDQFIYAASGSSDVDGGLIVGGTTIGQGQALYWDKDSDRWSTQGAVAHNATAVTPKQFVVTTTLSTDTPGSSDGDYGVGEMWLETDSQDIWIRTS